MRIAYGNTTSDVISFAIRALTKIEKRRTFFYRYMENE